MLRNKIILLVMIFSAIPSRAMQGYPRLTDTNDGARVKFMLSNGMTVHRRTDSNEITYSIPCADRSEAIISYFKTGPSKGRYRGSVVYLFASGRQGPEVIRLMNAQNEFKFLENQYIQSQVWKQRVGHIQSNVGDKLSRR